MTSPCSRLVIPAIRWDASDGFEAARAGALAALDLGVGGFILFGGPADEVASLTSDLTARAGRPLLFAADLERGAGQQFTGLTELPPPGGLGALGDLATIGRAARITATEARSVGINLILAPVADLDVEPHNPIGQSRSFGADPDTVGRAVAAWVAGCHSGGCRACVKHFPGHGRTTADSHAALPDVTASRAVLEADLLPFRAAVDEGVAAVMTAHVRYPALDPDQAATFSAPILSLLRTGLGFEGLVVTDALIMAGARHGPDEGAAAVAAIAAGVDALLYPHDVAATIGALERAMDQGTLSEASVTRASGRLATLLESVPPAVSPTPDARAWADGIADRLLVDGLVRGGEPRFRGPLSCVVIDDDLDGPYPPGRTDRVPRALASNASGEADEGTIVLLFCEPRGWKERAGLGHSAREALNSAAAGAVLIVVFGHPRLVEEVPGDAPVLVAWHRQELMQAAVVRWIEARR